MISNPPHNPLARKKRNGQVLLLVLVSIVILCVAALWLADIHHIILAKDKTQNAGDAAALEAARWQATTLNLIGELNLLHALALAQGDDTTCDTITNAQARIAFAGPLTGAGAAQQAAKLNGAPVREDYTQFVRDCADRVRHDYATTIGGQLALPEPWEGAWNDYADMIQAIADDGIAAGFDNAHFYSDPDGGHILLEEAFYRAVRGRDWCWFYHYAPGLLEQYTDASWWPALPDPDSNPPSSPELLGLFLRPYSIRFDTILKSGDIRQAMENEALDPLPDSNEAGSTNRIAHTWFSYDMGKWGSWEIMKNPAFPIDGDLRPEYDYEGADVVIRVENTIDRLSQNEEDEIVWVAAAKPFGFLASADDGNAMPPTLVPFVVPAYRDVRLIPLDASSSPDGGAFNLRWRRHCLQHLPDYLDNGIRNLSSSCRYCQALILWENDAFRDSGSRWLSTNKWKCTISPPGNGPGGGSFHAH